MSLQGQIALVTGATGGIGKAICRLLASEGCSIALHYKSDMSGAYSLAKELEKAYCQSHETKFVVCEADMANYDEVSTTGSYTGL
jgi:3-oxoacyl-[acyl-carrier protein] reductase